MTLKKLFLPIALFITATTAFAADISVTVKDKTTGEPIGYATVELLTPADSFLIGGMTNDNGFISIPCNAPECKIRISFMGYKTYEAPVTAQNMGVVFLEEDATQLSEVTVEASTRVTKIDRDVYVVTRDLKAGTATSRELLGKLNGVVYNPYDQSISFNGSTNILILVDGIETDQNMAKTLSPDRIERVEVIKDPVGKYAADGYRAVFNIMLKKDYSGIEVTANFNPMFNFVNRRGNPSAFMQENATLNILYTYKKLNLWGGYWGNHASELGMPVETVKQYGDLLVTTPPPDANHPDLKFINSADGAWLGGNYSLKEGNTLAFDLNYTGWSPRSTNVSDLTTSRNGVVIGRNQSITKTHNTNDALQATLTYKGKWSEKSSFEGDFRYRHSTPTNRSEFTQGAMQSVSYNSQIENFYRLNLAYSYQFSPKFSMDLGYGTMINHFNLYQNNTTLTQHQVRNRPSLYVNYAFSDKLNVKIGAMVEFYNQTFMDLEQTQTGFLPMVNVMYRPSDKFSVTAKYRANPGYPDINSLTTFMTQMDTLTWSVGNPNLEPGNFQEVALDFNILNRFTVSPFYNFDARNSQQYLYEDNGQYFQRPVNANYKSLGANINFTLPLAKTLFWQNWARFSNAWLSYNDAENDLFSLQFSSMFIYSLPQWDATVGAGVQKYITRWGTLQGYSSGGNDIPLLMLQKNFFNKRLSCSLLYIPPIEAGFIKYSQDNMTRTPTYYSFNSAGLKLLHNVMLFQFTYRFSAGKQIKVTKSSLDDDTSVKQKSAGF